MMHTWIDIVIFLIPSTAAALIAYWIINRPVRIEKVKTQLNREEQLVKTLTPVRLAAYERLILFLERITPTQMLPREMHNDMTALDLQITLLKCIRNEFEHNVSQQLYVGKAVWEEIIAAKESITELITVSATKVSLNDSGIKLAQIIVATYSSANTTACEAAKELLGEELRRLINE
ncbi:MAG: hypothetical protein LBS16_07045 [Prevotellaceae bacterium]|jgi:hypothetical protein|nr:hypothetical protein [Prevotellaceae bacterium]